MAELKPCPFCGGVAEVMYIEWCAMYAARCANEYGSCKILSETVYFVVEREAIEAWNRRANADS